MSFAKSLNLRLEGIPNNKESEGSKNFDSTDVESKKEASEELSGKLRKDYRDDKLLHSKIPLNNDKVDKSRVLNDAINNNMNSFCPDSFFENMVNNYSLTNKISGNSMLRALTGYSSDHIDKNINFPEFKRDLRDRIKKSIADLKKEGLLDKDGFISDEGFEFASLSLLSEELDTLEGKGLLGENKSKDKSLFGNISDFRNFRRGDSYKQISPHKSVRRAIRRGHNTLLKDDFVSCERESTGRLEIIYVVDNSGSMKGSKISMAKKAGVALMYKAINNKDKVGLVIFGSKLSKLIHPTSDFYSLLRDLNLVKTGGETDLVLGLDSAINLFSSGSKTKHVVLLTDVLQTFGKNPEQEVLSKVSEACNRGVSISIIGIGLNKQGESLAKRIVDVSNGSLFKVSHLEDLDQIILEDYYRVRKK